MKHIYSTLNLLIRGLDQIDGARRMDLLTEMDGPGEQIAKAIRDSENAIGKIYDSSDAQAISEDPAEFDGFDDDVEESDLSPVFYFPEGVDEEDAIRKLAGGTGEDYERQVLQRGIDAFGWYVSFHQKRYQWGIYLPLRGAAALADLAMQNTPIIWTEKFRIAYRFILTHERFHFAADLGIASIERMVEKPIWWPIRDLPKDRRDFLLLPEEGLATAASLREARYSKQVSTRKAYLDLGRFVWKLPPGYRDAHHVAKTRYIMESEVLAHAQEAWCLALGSRHPDGVELQHLYPAFRPVELSRCPTHVLGDDQRFELSNLSAYLIESVTISNTEEKFDKKLRQLPMPIQQKWAATKGKLAQSVLRGGLDFKKWPNGGDGCFSVRVDKGYRAHLRLTPSDRSWTAEDIGSHKEMGHG
jgi:hypothetical protein